MVLWLKAFHIIFAVCWFAGIFYLPRLFVYHAMAEDQTTRSHLALMQQKLYRFMHPFAALTVLLGIGLISTNASYYLSSGWLHAKITLVVLLMIYHVICGRIVKQHANGSSSHHSHVRFRWFNEFPVLLLFGIVILAVVRPF